MAQHQRRLDRVLAPTYLEGLDGRTLDDIRAMQRECTDIETEVSYVRRLAQARIDILQAELDRRAAGGSLGDLIDALPEILADSAPRSAAANTRLATSLAPSMTIAWNRGLEHLVSDATLVNLPTLSDEELRATMAQLRELEVEVSNTRRSLHTVLDAVERELAHRITAGPD